MGCLGPEQLGLSAYTWVATEGSSWWTAFRASTQGGEGVSSAECGGRGTDQVLKLPRSSL